MRNESPDHAFTEHLPATTRGAPSWDTVADLLGKAALDLCTQGDLEATMAAVARNAVEIIGGETASAALFSSRRRRLNLSAATTDRAREADGHQFEPESGPSYAAMHEAKVITVPDMAMERRWRRWASASYELGLRSMLAVPLDLSPYHWAVMNVYWDRSNQPSDEGVAAAALYAPHAAVAIINARQSFTLREAIQCRHQIGLAQGILMERLGLDTRQSFDVLRRHSRDNNIKLNRIAKDVVETRSVRPAGEEAD